MSPIVNESIVGRRLRRHWYKKNYRYYKYIIYSHYRYCAVVISPYSMHFARPTHKRHELQLGH
jgi:hypothetical protein